MGTDAGDWGESLLEALGRRGLKGSDAERLLAFGSPSSFREGKILFWQGDPAESAFLVVLGCVVPLKFAGGSDSFELPARRMPSWVGLGETLAEARYGYDATAPEGCEALRFSRYNLERALASGPAARYLLGELAGENCRLLKALEAEKPIDRIIEYLLLRRRAGSASATLPLTQARVAKAIGATRETVNKRLKDLERAGLVRTGRGAIEVSDWEALEGYASR
jgi:CRP/FNR family transcriptional regulator, cyclic AMP receptor protein